MRNESKWANDHWLAVSCDRTDNGLDEAINSLTGRCVGWAYDKADANLIAAAPELYEALEYVIKQIPELGTVPGIAEAMAKARGES